MSEEELRRPGVMSRVAAGVLKLVKGAELLRVSYRQAKRLWRRYRDKGRRGWCMGMQGGVRAEPSRRGFGGRCWGW